MRIRLAALIAGATLIAGCHSEPTSPDDSGAALDLTLQLRHIADSVAANGGDPSEVGAYRGLAALLEGTGRISTVTVSVDGVASEYLATAQEITLDGCPPGAICTAMLSAPIRSVVAWQKSDPRRAVQLFTADFSGQSWANDPQVGGSLVFLDGSGAMYGGQSTTHAVSVQVGTAPCDPPDIEALAIYAPIPCTHAEFDVAFDGTTTLIPLANPLVQGAAPATNAAPSHHVTMTRQRVHGVHIQLAGLCIDSCSNPPGITPPASPPWRDSLTATLTATVGSDVTFTFTVTNPKSTSAVVQFSDGQQFDIRVWDDDNAQLWQWSAGQGFTQSLTSRTLAPGESATYVAHWTPPASGSYHAMAYLTSSSHGAVAFANVTRP